MRFPPDPVDNNVPVDPHAGGERAWRFCVAPMMDWTDRHCRYFHRRLSRHARLYTEMVHAQAVLRGDRQRLLRFDPSEQPLALQLGGSHPATLAQACRVAQDWGYDEINLNCGCPSSRVQEGRFGACLMREPQLVADCVAAMRDATRLPVTVKCRIGVDEQEEDRFLHQFVETVSAAGCTTFIVHARKAWLSGLSPKENREVPPLRYDVVHRVKSAFPQLTVVINGGIALLDQAAEQLDRVDGVMLGRAAYENPWLLAQIDARLFADRQSAAASRHTVLHAMRDYIEAELAAGTPLAAITRHVLGLFRGQPGGRAFRRVLSEQAPRPGAGFRVIEAALEAVGSGLAAAA